MSASAIFVLDLKGKVSETLELIADTDGSASDGHVSGSVLTLFKNRLIHSLNVLVEF